MESEIEAELRWQDLMKYIYHMSINQMTTEMAEARKHGHVMIQAGTLRSEEAESWEGEYVDWRNWVMKIRCADLE